MIAIGDNHIKKLFTGTSRTVITNEMFSEAISEAINRAGNRNAGTPMDQSTAGNILKLKQCAVTYLYHLM